MQYWKDKKETDKHGYNPTLKLKPRKCTSFFRIKTKILNKTKLDDDFVFAFLFKKKKHLGFWSIASGKAICHCKISSSCLSELEQFFHEMLHCMVTSVLKGGKSIEMLIFLKEVCCLYSANSWRMSVFSLCCHPFKSEALKVWFWFLNSLPCHLGQIAYNNVRICGKRILVTTCFLQHFSFFKKKKKV